MKSVNSADIGVDHLRQLNLPGQFSWV